MALLERFEALVRAENSDEQNRVDLVLAGQQRDYLSGVKENCLDEKLQTYQEILS